MMDKENRINEIARDLCPFSKDYASCTTCNDELDIGDEPCLYAIMAKLITAKGYVKCPCKEGEHGGVHDKPQS